jgi:formylglycine-generating enzyme required for sulfatase activity
VPGKLAEQEREARQRQAGARRRRKLTLAAVAIMLLVVLGWWLAVAVARHCAAAREQRIASEREAAFEAACAEGDRHLAENRWTEAEATFRKALAMPGHENDSRPASGLKAAQAQKLAAEAQATYAAAVAAAQRAIAAGDWEAAAQEVGKALAMDSKGGEALALAAKLEPTLSVAAELDGRDAPGAQITIDGAAQQQATPASYKLERGKIYAISVTLPPTNGRFFTTAEARIAVDWQGPKTLTAKIKAVPGPAEDKVWTVPELGMELVYVAPGSFQMGFLVGGTDTDPASPYTVHTVRISHGFWLGKYEVTQAEWQALMGTTLAQQMQMPSVKKQAASRKNTMNDPRLPSEGPRYPMCYVSWNDAMEFCRKLSESERAAGRLPVGYEYRLPTEAEWEYAARGGTKSVGTSYSGSDNLDEVAWGSANSGDERLDGLDRNLKNSLSNFRKEISSNCRTHQVGLKKANEFGLHDMTGNVAEFCLDWADLSYYWRSPKADPVNLVESTDWTFWGRAQRGGDFEGSRFSLRLAFRTCKDPDLATPSSGFRACLAPAITTR